MPALTDEARTERRQKYSNQWVASKAFKVKRQGACTGCNKVILEGEDACFRRWEGLGNQGHLVHYPDCVDRNG
jgi:hypothetical protein